MTIRLLFVFWCCALLLLAYSDSDMDGVEDYEDKCPHTQFDDLVNYDGCGKSGNDKKVDYTLVLGTRYAQKNYSSQLDGDTHYLYIQSDISYLKWNFETTISYYRLEGDNSVEYGIDDTLLTLSYETISNEAFSLSLGGGVILPTYKSLYRNEATDYMFFLNALYALSDYTSFFTDYAYTFIGDEDVQNSMYRNVHSWQIGMGLAPTQKQTYTFSYNRSDSIYENIETIEELRFGLSYAINKNLFGGITYDYGLSKSASAHTFGCYIGYDF